MSHHEAFLQAILENPDDDGLRLVYADWLQEHAQSERAEFIRLQVARVPKRGELGDRERELLHQYGEEWARPLRRWVDSWQFRRGFVEGVVIRPEAFLEHADALFQAAPVQRVSFQTGMFQFGRPHLVHLSAGPIMPRLAACPYLARLSALGFWQNGLGDGGVGALAASPHLARLTSLDLTSNGAGDAGAMALASSPGLARLTTLKLGSNRIGLAGARALASSRHITLLAALDLGENPVGDEGITLLAESPNLRHLTTLVLTRTGLGTAGARALATSPNLARLKLVDVRDNGIGNRARQELRLRFGKGKCRF